MGRDTDKYTPSIGPKPSGAVDAVVTVWDDAGRRGQSFSLINQDSPYVGDSFNDQISSIEVKTGTWRFFLDESYNRPLFDLGPGSYVPNLQYFEGNQNDRISSIQLLRY